MMACGELCAMTRSRIPARPPQWCAGALGFSTALHKAMHFMGLDQVNQYKKKKEKGGNRL